MPPRAKCSSRVQTAPTASDRGAALLPLSPCCPPLPGCSAGAGERAARVPRPGAAGRRRLLQRRGQAARAHGEGALRAASPNARPRRARRRCDAAARTQLARKATRSCLACVSTCASLTRAVPLVLCCWRAPAGLEGLRSQIMPELLPWHEAMRAAHVPLTEDRRDLARASLAFHVSEARGVAVAALRRRADRQPRLSAPSGRQEARAASQAAHTDRAPVVRLACGRRSWCLCSCGSCSGAAPSSPPAASECPPHSLRSPSARPCAVAVCTLRKARP